MKYKRGQVTLFVIIGLVILLAVALIYFLTRVLSVDQPLQETPDVSIETRPASLLITTCLQSNMLEGLQELGSQGGLLHPPAVQYPSYKGGSVLFEPYAVPYWRYLDECGHPSGCELSNQPPLCSTGTYCGGVLPSGPNSIQEQLEQYIVENIETCIDGFSSIADQYDISRTAQDVEVTVIFADDITRAVLSYPIVLRSFSTGNTQTIETFQAEVPIDMYKVYGMADEIMRFVRQTNYYEQQTVQLLSVYGGVEGEALIPPMDEINFGKAAGPWIQSEVQQELEQTILPFMSLIRYANTANGYPLIADDQDQYTQYVNGFYTTFLPKTSNEIYDLEVYHQYIYDPIYLIIDDGSQLIEAKPYADIDNPLLRAITNFALQDYRFSYDVSYPLVISIRDDNALDGQGYSFDFAIEVNVRNNVPAYQNFTYLQSVETVTKGLGDFLTPTKYTFITRDKHTKEALDSVRITYVCGNEYFIGVSELILDQAQLIAQLPPCEYGGYIRYQADGYLGEAIPFNNRDDMPDQTMTLELWPIQEREIIIRKRSFDDIQSIIDAGVDGIFTDSYTDITLDDSIIFSVEREQTSPYDTTVPLLGFLRYQLENATAAAIEYDSLIQLGVENGFYTPEQAQELLAEAQQATPTTASGQDTYTMEFVPGNYTIDATLLHLPGIFLPAETIDPESGVFDIFIDDEVDMEEQRFHSWIKGGSETNISLTEADVYRDTPIIFYVLETDLPSSWSDLINTPNYQELLPLYSGYLQPELS